MQAWRNLAAAVLAGARRDGLVLWLRSEWAGDLCDLAGVDQRQVVEAAERTREKRRASERGGAVG